MSIAIVDYGSGNLHSARKAFVQAMENIKAEGSVLVHKCGSGKVEAHGCEGSVHGFGHSSLSSLEVAPAGFGSVEMVELGGSSD